MSKIKSKLKFLRLYTTSRINSPQLDIGTIFVTRRCNKKCGYCSTKKDYNPEEELSLEEDKEVIDKFKEFGVWYLTISGGEPTLRSDLADIVRYAHNKGMFTIVNTNGSFSNISIDDVVKAGIDIVDIAIDSMSNPRFKNYDGVRETLERLVKSDVGVKLNYCILKENYHETAKILGLTEHYRIPISIHLGELSPLPTSISYDSTPFFKKGDKGDIKQVEEISRLLAERARKSILMLNPPEYFEAWPRFMQGEELEWKCKAGETSLCVDYNGAILQCVSAEFPVEIDGKVLNYRDLNRANINSIKEEVQELTEQCRSKCLSCTYMLEHYSMEKPLRVLRIVFSF